jgi:hypothetical protein
MSNKSGAALNAALLIYVVSADHLKGTEMSRTDARLSGKPPSPANTAPMADSPETASDCERRI